MSERKQHHDKRMEKIRLKRKRKKQRILIVLAESIILIILCLGAYGMNKYNKFQVVDIDTTQIQVNEGAKKEGYTTIALFGGDSREGALEAGTHADSIIVASINNSTKEVRMVSVYRDTLLRQIDGELKKANNAYFFGGPEEALNELNVNLDLDIMEYVTVDFKALVNTIDLIGGIDVEIMEDEVEAMNDYIEETAIVSGVEANYIQESGLQHLDGAQAVTYARIRKTEGGDFRRTERQQEVLQKMIEKGVQMNLKTMNEIIDVVFPQISTSLSIKEIISLGSSLTEYTLAGTNGFPTEKGLANLDGVGSCVVPLNLDNNVIELHAFLYPEEEYTVSETVIDINTQIINMTTGFADPL